uniref:TonB-dependent receptor n=1 Tax=Pedobacter schmidteae TaxID=2201271 RepID=UPI000EB413F6|nr:carboxypeptidase-like regulatory domain-containing protein [Pedobacter schmidteae]
MKYFFFIVVMLMAAGYRHAHAQTILDQKISIQFDSVGIDQFVEAIEAKANCHFYYNKRAFDSFFVKHTFYDEKIKEILNKSFFDYKIYYAADDDGSIYLTTEKPIVLALGEYIPLPIEAGAATKREAGSKKINNDVYSPLKRAAFEENKIYDIGYKSSTFNSGNATLAGYVKHSKSGEGVSGASISVLGSTTRTVTDQFGYYSITLPKGPHTIKVNFIGLEDTKRNINLYSDGKLNIAMVDFITALNVVTISTEKSSNVKSTVMGAQKISIKNVKQLPRLLGEADLVRVLLTLPGVTSVGEGSTGMNVRGGAVDQNLVLFDGATIFNPAHFFGFFSGFNAEVVKDAELYKSSIPVKYGSRLSSVLEVVTREGNRNKISGSGGIGPLSGNVTLEGPIGKKTSFIIGGRSTYSDWTLGLLENEQFRHSSAKFYDANLRITHDINDKNTVYLTGYKSGDRFKLDGDTTYRYGNSNAVLKWKHNFNNRLFSVFAVGYDHYDFNMISDRNTINDYHFNFNIGQVHGKAEFVYTPNAKHKFEAGLSAIRISSNPGDYKAIGKGAAIPVHIQQENALETALYFSDNYTINPNLSFNLGFRANMYNYLGPREVYQYAQAKPRTEESITDTLPRTGNIKNYFGFEPRISVRYSFSANASIKLSYNRTRQNIHMLSNTTAVNPTDTWKLSDEYIRPQIGDQLAIGYFRNFKDNSIETSLEVYYKRIQHALTYKNAAKLLLNSHIETDVANATGKAYGLELLIKKTAGKLNGWISYTYSRTLMKMDDPLVEEPINKGNYFPADYDKPHVFNFISNYKFSHRFSVSLTANYATGRPITMPVARYYYGGSYRMLYDDRNNSRVPDYFRTDLSINIEGNHKVKKLFHSSFTLGVYNLTGRRNPYSVYFTAENGKINGYKLSIIGTAIPFATYNFKF